MISGDGNFSERMSRFSRFSGKLQDALGSLDLLNLLTALCNRFNRLLESATHHRCKFVPKTTGPYFHAAFSVHTLPTDVSNSQCKRLKMQMSFGKARLALVFAFVLLAVNFLAAQKLMDGAQQSMEPTGEGHGVRPAQPDNASVSPFAVVTGNGINYHNGPVMKASPVHAYIIWYGNWAGTGSNTAATQGLIQHFLGSIGGSNIEKVNTTYGDTTGNVSGNVAFSGSTTVGSSTNLSDSGVLTQVSNAITSGRLPKDVNGVYFVL